MYTFQSTLPALRRRVAELTSSREDLWAFANLAIAKFSTLEPIDDDDDYGELDEDAGDVGDIDDLLDAERFWARVLGRSSTTSA